ncbi:hypothetical protein KIPB_005530 [Kipferlia bialata]|uniref:FGFR1 oncogene partner (FOP) N-terminal dimerisation domain-containing protein n=1 Tax=Kipferlia bialata TaxID=797122 RepID=A0A9K3CVI7_9EUKA|nr:hypothetical protein KIPB_005530 [Kipferlia bialata]|eukprot:g5530.t1
MKSSGEYERIETDVRAAVVKAFEGSLPKPTTSLSGDSWVLASLIREFLVFHGFAATAKCLNGEAGLPDVDLGRQFLCREAGVPHDKMQDEIPLLYHLLNVSKTIEGKPITMAGAEREREREMARKEREARERDMEREVTAEREREAEELREAERERQRQRQRDRDISASLSLSMSGTDRERERERERESMSVSARDTAVSVSEPEGEGEEMDLDE